MLRGTKKGGPPLLGKLKGIKVLLQYKNDVESLDEKSNNKLTKSLIE